MKEWPQEIDYCRSDGPPINWHMYEVIHMPSGDVLDKVNEANAKEGWIVRYVTDDRGRLVQDETTREAKMERVECRIKIRLQEKYRTAAPSFSKGGVLPQSMPILTVVCGGNGDDGPEFILPVRRPLNPNDRS